MSFASRFKSPNSNPTDVPPGVNIAHTSFGYNKNQTPYSIPPVSKPVTNTQTVRPRGGWDDDDEEEENPQIRGGSGPYRGDPTAQPTQPTTKPTVSNGSHDTGFAPSRKKVDPNVEFAFLECDSNFMQAHEHENNIINEMIQPGGARLKQPDNLLNNFCRASENFQASAVGSLLLTKLTEDIVYVSKARTLFAIETLVKKIPKYFSYFKHNLPILQSIDFASEGSNASQLLKILEDISNHLLDISKPKPTSQFTQQIPIKTTTQSANLLEGDGDLLGMGTTAPTEQPKSKQDPFAFVSNQPTPNVEQPRKFDPFAISGGQTSNPAPVNTTTTTSKPTGGLPGNFKKFHANANTPNTVTNPTPIQVQTQPVTQPRPQPRTQPSHSNDLLGALNDLHFEASPSQSPTLVNNQQNTPQNTVQNGQNNLNKGGFSGQTQGFGNQPGPSGGYNMGNQWNYGNNQPQGMNVNMNMNMNANMNMNMGMYGNNNQFYGQQQQQQQQRGYPNQNYQPQGNFGYGGNNAGNYGGFNNGGFQGNNMNMVDPIKKFDDMDNLLKQDWTFASEDDKKKKQKSENEKAFDSLRF